MSLASYHCSTPGSLHCFYFAGAAAPTRALPPLWPLNMRVGENSPSLCAIMSSVTNSFVKFLPLWIMNVWPMKSGTIVQSRAQVLIGSRLPVRCCFSTFASRRSLTYGPFLMERPIHSPLYRDCIFYERCRFRPVHFDAFYFSA